MPRSARSSSPRVTAVDRALLRRWGLAAPAAGADKEERGRVLVVGGSREIPGAVLLAATAALRAGAGKLQIATISESALHVGLSMPEAKVIALGSDEAGNLAADAGAEAGKHAARSHATIVGPGMSGGDAIGGFLDTFLRHPSLGALVLDAGVVVQLGSRRELLAGIDGEVLLTPHIGELALMTGMRESEIERNPAAVALEVARDTGCVVSLKGPDTLIAGPDGAVYRYRLGDVGLATSGSGDVLAGIAGGLMARGVPAVRAAAFASFIHGAAGRRLARRFGRIGFIARDLLAEIPPAMASAVAR